MSLVISDDSVKASGFAENKIFLGIVLMLFRQDKISLGKVSELMRLHAMQFQKLLSDRGICVHSILRTDLGGYSPVIKQLSVIRMGFNKSRLQLKQVNK
jgi:predicted HTH domain antitoxin